MQLPDEAVEYDYQGVLIPVADVWTPLAEIQADHLLNPADLNALSHLVTSKRGQIAAERELQSPPPDMTPLHAGFIDYPQKLLDNHRRKGEASELGRVLNLAAHLREQVDRVVILGVGGSSLGTRALFQSLCHTYHNELSEKVRMGKPRIYFEGDAFDNDALQDLLELLENTCVDPEIREERWGVVVVSKSGSTLETMAAYRVFRAEAARFFGSHDPRLKTLIIPVTGQNGRLRDLSRADGLKDDSIPVIPDNIGGRYSVFSPAGLLPAAVMGLDVRALLLGAAAMTRRFLEEGFDRNTVLQFAAVNHLMYKNLGKSTRVLAVWSKKLEALGHWYDQLISESLGKAGKGPTPLTAVHTRDLHSRTQLFQDGPRDKMVNNLVVKGTRHPPIAMSMADRNEDDLNVYNRKTYPDLMDASLRGSDQAYGEVARPTAELTLPALSEHAMGQLMQMLMLATVVEGRLMGVNPYGQPGADPFRKHMQKVLREPKG